MTCDIHLYVEKRNRELKTVWYPCSCEMQECYNQVFKDNEDDDYGEWLGLLNYMKAIESNGKYDVRAVFWFDG